MYASQTKECGELCFFTLLESEETTVLNYLALNKH